MVTQSYPPPDRGTIHDNVGVPDEVLVDLRAAIERRNFAAARRASRSLIRPYRVVLTLITPDPSGRDMRSGK